MFLFSRFRSAPAAKARSGITLIELLIVVALVATLGGLLLGGGRHAVESGRCSRARAELAAWAAALEDYRASHGDYPGSLDLLQRESATLVDPWAHPYRYAYKSQSPWTNPGYVLFSAGPDGVASESLRAGGFADPGGAGNADNLSANPP